MYARPLETWSINQWTASLAYFHVFPIPVSFIFANIRIFGNFCCFKLSSVWSLRKVTKLGENTRWEKKKNAVFIFWGEEFCCFWIFFVLNYYCYLFIPKQPISIFFLFSHDGFWFFVDLVSARRSALGLKVSLVFIHVIYVGILFLFYGDLIEKTKREPWYVKFSQFFLSDKSPMAKKWSGFCAEL